MFMKKSFNSFRIFVLLGLVILVSSCNRGVGCPNNFKISDAFESVVAGAVQLFL
jgi:hypothetical protein